MIRQMTVPDHSDPPDDDQPPAEVIPPTEIPTPPSDGTPRRNPTERDPSDERREGPSVGVPLDAPPERIGDEDVVFSDRDSSQPPGRFRQAVEILSDTTAELVTHVDPQLLFEKLDDFQEGLKQSDRATKLTIGGVAIASRRRDGRLYVLDRERWLLVGQRALEHAGLAIRRPATDL